jgi:hypothetical protein
MIGTEVQSAAPIFAVRIDHAADIGQTAIDLLIAVGMIAERRHTVADVAAVLACANSPTHLSLLFL